MATNNNNGRSGKKSELVSKINSTSFLSLNKETQERAYYVERDKLITNLYEYVLLLDEEKYFDCAEELMIAFESSVKSYNTEKGTFLNYFLYVFKSTFKVSKAKQVVDYMTGGIHFPDEARRKITKMVQYMQSKGIDPYRVSDNVIEQLSEEFGFATKEIRELLIANCNCVVDRSVIKEDDDDAKDDEVITIIENVGFEDSAIINVDDRKQVEKLFDIIEQLYADCQDRQKPIISKCITAMLSDAIIKVQMNVVGCSFIDKELLRACIVSGSKPTQREIAEQFGRKPESINRTFKDFIRNLMERIRSDKSFDV